MSAWIAEGVAFEVSDPFDHLGLIWYLQRFHIPQTRNWLITGRYSDWTLRSATLQFLEKKLGSSNTTLENILSNCVMPLGGELIILSRFFYAQETKFLEGNFMHIKIKVRTKNCSSVFFWTKMSVVYHYKNASEFITKKFLLKIWMEKQKMLVYKCEFYSWWYYQF